MGETVDVLVAGTAMTSNNNSGRYLTLHIAASWGSGSRGGRVSSLICFVQANHIQGMNGRTMQVQITHETTTLLLSIVFLDTVDPHRYQTFVRIGSGLNFGDYEWVNAKPWKRVDKEKLPPWFLASPAGSEDKGDVYLEPEEWEHLMFFQTAD